MTYILATVRHGVSTIVADSRITSELPNNSHDDMAKVGILFPGCIFGVAGSTEGLDPFISNFQESAGIDGHDLSINWEYFKKYAAAYTPSDQFQVVLSQRTTGSPRLYLYDSSLRKVSPCGDFITLGSGKQFFDSPVRDWIDTELGAVEQRLISLHGDSLLFPNFICHILIEIVQGEDAAFYRRQEIGIGGVFHYVVQNHLLEQFQVPSIYLILSREGRKKRHVRLTYFRVCGTEYGLTIQGSPPFDVLPSLHLDMSKHWNVRRIMSRKEWKEFHDQVLIQLNKLPRYNFLGICFSEKKYRGTLIVDTTFSRDYAWTIEKQFVFKPAIQRKIDEIYDAVDYAEQTGH